MQLPRDVGAALLLSRLRRLGYAVLRRRGSHMTLYTPELGGHRAWVPDHKTIAPGTLRTILSGIAGHFDLSLEQLLARLEL